MTGTDCFERAFEHAAIGMMMLTRRLEITRVNSALCALLGRQPEALLGRSPLDFTHPEDRQRVEESVSMLGGDPEVPLVVRYLRRTARPSRRS